MKPFRLLIAVALLGGLGGLVWWSNRAEKAKEGQPAKDAPPKILSLAAGTVKQIDIKRREGERTSVRLSGSDKWEITSPKVLPADPAAVIGITSTASNLTADRVVDENVENATDLASYGLAPALLEVTLGTTDGKSTRLLIGDTTPAGSNVYAKLDGNPRLFVMPSYSKSAFDKVAQDLRDKRLMSFTQEKISRIELTARKQTFEFGKVSDTQWQIVKPKPMRADGLQVDELIAKLKGAQMDPGTTDASAKADAAKFAAGTVAGIAKVTDSVGTQTLEVRKSKEDYYAKSSAVEGVYKVGKEVGEALDKALDDFRNKKLFDFGFNDPTKVDVKDGDKTLSVRKDNAKWLGSASGNKEMDSTSVQAFIDRLRDLSAAAFAEKGFTTPAVTITVASSDGKRTEKVEISQAAGGMHFLARRDDDSSLYELGADTVKELRQAVGDVREAQSGAKDKAGKKK